MKRNNSKTETICAANEWLAGWLAGGWPTEAIDRRWVVVVGGLCVCWSSVGCGGGACWLDDARGSVAFGRAKPLRVSQQITSVCCFTRVSCEISRVILPTAMPYPGSSHRLGVIVGTALTDAVVSANAPRQPTITHSSRPPTDSLTHSLTHACEACEACPHSIIYLSLHSHSDSSTHSRSFRAVIAFTHTCSIIRCCQRPHTGKVVHLNGRMTTQD